MEKAFRLLPLNIMLAVSLLWRLFIKLTNIIEYVTAFQFQNEVFIFAFDSICFVCLFFVGIFGLFVMVPTTRICVVINIK